MVLCYKHAVQRVRNAVTAVRQLLVSCLPHVLSRWLRKIEYEVLEAQKCIVKSDTEELVGVTGR
jgi:hypothetical protein